MSNPDPLELRVQLARGHWSLGECGEALLCLERAAELGDPPPRLLELARRYHSELEISGAESALIARARALCESLAPAPPPAAPVETPTPRPTPSANGGALATATMAELLASQGHRERALQVAEEVLRRNPRDERALALKRRLTPPEEVEEVAAPEPEPQEAELEAAFVAETEPELEPEPLLEPELERIAAQPAALDRPGAEPMQHCPELDAATVLAQEASLASDVEPEAGDRERVIQELSRWLENVRSRYAQRRPSRPGAIVGGPSA